MTALITQPGTISGHGAAASAPHANEGGKADGPAKANERDGTSTRAPDDVSIEHLDAARSREITAKAVSGVLLLLLKWFKLSRECASTEPVIVMG